MSDVAKQPRQVGFDGKDTVWLLKPVDAYGDTIDKLVFRPPLGKDMKLGMPFKIWTENDVTYQAPDMAIVHGYAWRLAGVPPSAIDALCAQDMKAVTQAITSFFAEEESPSTFSIDITTSPGGGEVEVLKPSSRSTLMASSNLSDRRSA